MRILPWLCAMFFAGATAAVADPASFPIMPDVQYSQTAQGVTAHVRVTVYDDASPVDIEVYGLDGMRAADANLVRMHRDSMAKGESLDFDISVHPGPGRSSLAVTAKAKFAHAGGGDTVRTFPYGVENAAQQQEHSRCVRKDPEGAWIRLPDCDDAPPDMSVAQFKAAPQTGKIARLTAYVVDTYLCPPCPEGAMCKPCMSHSSITIDNETTHMQGAPEITIAVPDPAPFKSGIQYRFEIAPDADGGLDGRVLRSQPASEPAWTTPSP